MKHFVRVILYFVWIVWLVVWLVELKHGVLVWCGLKHGARVEKQPFSYTLEDVADWLDEKPEAMEEVLNVFSSSFSSSEEEKK